MSQIADIFAKNLKTRRARLGWTQQDLADHCDYSLENIKRIETGKNFVSASGMERIANALGCRPSELIEPEKERKFSGTLTIHDSVEILDRLSSTPPLRRALVLALLFDDKSLLPDKTPQELKDALHGLSGAR